MTQGGKEARKQCVTRHVITVDSYGTVLLGTLCAESTITPIAPEEAGCLSHPTHHLWVRAAPYAPSLSHLEPGQRLYRSYQVIMEDTGDFSYSVDTGTRHKARTSLFHVLIPSS